MKKVLLFLVFHSFLIISCLTGTDRFTSPPPTLVDAPQQSSSEDTLQTLLEDLSLLFKNGTGDEHVRETYRFVKEKEEGGMLTYAVTADDAGIFGGAHFTIRGGAQEPAEISITETLLAAYPSHKAAVMGVIVHEYRHAYDYFTQPETVAAGVFSNPLEAYLYEMDALFIEALFLRDYPAREPSIPLGEFERFLIKSLGTDDLQEASLLFLQKDSELTYSMLETERRYEEGAIQFEEYLSAFLSLADSCLERIDGTSGSERYAALIAAHTFDYFAAYILSPLFEMELSEKQKELLASCTAGLNERKREIVKVLWDNALWLDEYRNAALEKFLLTD